MQQLEGGVLVQSTTCQVEALRMLIGERSSPYRVGVLNSSLNLSLNEIRGQVRVEEGPAHFGIQVQTADELRAVGERLRAAGLETRTEAGTTCCYAVQDKLWVVDPDGRRWEIFVVLQADVRDESPHPTACCGPNVVTLATDAGCAPR